MSVSSETTAIEYVGAGGTGPFAINFPFLATGDIEVTLWPVAGSITSLTAGDDSTVYVMAQEPGAANPVVGDVMRDEDDNKGTLTDVEDNGDGTFDLTVLNSDPFSPVVTDTLNIKTPLGADDFTVTRDADGQGGSLVTDDIVYSPTIVTIWRNTALTQPTELALAGPLPSDSIETALDRLCMQLQELERRLRELEGNPSDSFVSVPAGATELKGLQVFANSGARTAAIPTYVGQLGVQSNTGTVYRGTAESVGAWTELKHRAWDHYLVKAYNASVGTLTGLHIGTSPEDYTAIEAVVCVVTAGTVDMDVQIVAMPSLVTVATGTLPVGAKSIAILSAAVVAAGEALLIYTSSGYGAPDQVGLEVFIKSDRV